MSLRPNAQQRVVAKVRKRRKRTKTKLNLALNLGMPKLTGVAILCSTFDISYGIS